MPSRKRQISLEKLGVDITSSEMQVFKAVLIAAGGTSKPTNYNEIASSLELIAGRKYTKAYIYRRLNSLEENGFIIVDVINTPRTYTITDSSVVEALEAKRKSKLSESLLRKKDVTTRLNRLESIKKQELALMFHKQLLGTKSIDKSQVVEGIENVRSAIIQEFADYAKTGDRIRVLGHASTLAEGLGPGGVTELKVIQAGFRGVKVQGLLTPVGQENLDLNLMARHLAPMVEIFEQATKTGNIHLKLTREPINTYRIVCLNEDKMLLYLTHAKESDVAAVIHRDYNPGLIDDAIKTFDHLWETGIDVLDMVKQVMKKETT
ncbi:MAG: hypothetical protein ACFFDQ_08945 [Candidatus Thorarchaeota archaeon]